MLRLAIGEGDHTYRAALEAICSDEPDLRCVGAASSVDSVVAVISTTGADVAAVDVQIRGGGIVAVAKGLRTRNLEVRLIALAAMPSIGARRAADDAGARSLLAKSDGELILRAIRAQED